MLGVEAIIEVSMQIKKIVETIKEINMWDKIARAELTWAHLCGTWLVRDQQLVRWVCVDGRSGACRAAVRMRTAYTELFVCRP